MLFILNCPKILPITTLWHCGWHPSETLWWGVRRDSDIHWYRARFSYNNNHRKQQSFSFFRWVKLLTIFIVVVHELHQKANLVADLIFECLRTFLCQIRLRIVPVCSWARLFQWHGGSKISNEVESRSWVKADTQPMFTSDNFEAKLAVARAWAHSPTIIKKGSMESNP